MYCNSFLYLQSICIFFSYNHSFSTFWNNDMWSPSPRTSLFHVKMEETDTGNAWPQTPRLSDAEHQTSLGQTAITRLSETRAVPVHVQFTPRNWSHLTAILNTHLPCLPSAPYKEGHTPRSACLPEIAASHSLTRDTADQSSAADTNSWIYAPSKLSTKKRFF